MSGRTQVAYNGSFGISTVYKNLKMLSGDEYRRVASGTRDFHSGQRK